MRPSTPFSPRSVNNLITSRCGNRWRPTCNWSVPIRRSNTPDELRERIGSAPLGSTCENLVCGRVEGFLAAAGSLAPSGARRCPTSRPHRNTDDRTVLEYGFAKSVGRATPFSLEALRDRLRLQGLHRPAMDGGTIDWNQVELRRQQFNLLYGGQFPLRAVAKKGGSRPSHGVQPLPQRGFRFGN